MDSIVEYHKLQPHKALQRRKERPLAYMGLGILEWHGRHNPLGLDGLKAHELACRLAERLGGLVMPPQFWGDNRQEICELVFDPKVSEWLPEGTFDHTVGICASMELDKQLLIKDAERSKKNGGWRLWKELMVHSFFQLESLGFKAIIAIPGHYPLFSPLDDAIGLYAGNGGKCQIFVLKDTMFDENGNAGDHAAKFETSLMMSLCPELVNLDLLDHDLSKPNIGVLGEDPRRFASREFGFEILAKFEEITKKFIQSSGL